MQNRTMALLFVLLIAGLSLSTGCDDPRSRRSSSDDPLNNAAPNNAGPNNANDTSPDVTLSDTTEADVNNNDTSNNDTTEADVSPDLPGDLERCTSAVGCATDLCAYGDGDECRDVCILDARGEGAREFYCAQRCTTTLECGELEVCLETELALGASGPRYCVRYLPECGNRVLDDGEACDDGDNEDGDGCNATCTSDETCGNTFIDPDEVCDDGDNEDGDGCNATCTSDETCGNTFIDPGEDCDDGNEINGDGCDACAFSGCGNLIVSDDEGCDDGNDDDSDGCDATCQVIPELITDREGQPIERATLGAIDPDAYVLEILTHTDADTILVSWVTNLGLWRGLHSVDNGESWERSVTLAEGFDVSSTRARYNGFVTLDDALIAWSFNRAEDTLAIRRSMDQGATWDQPMIQEAWPRPLAGQVDRGFSSWTHDDVWYMAWTEDTDQTVQVRRSLDQGSSFEPVASMGQDTGCTSPLLIHLDDEGHALLGACGALFRSDDYSASFEPVEDPPSGLGLASMVSLGGGVFVAVRGQRVWRTEDGGLTWQETTFPGADGEPQVLALQGDDVVWFSGDGAQNQFDPVTIDTALSRDRGLFYTPTIQLTTIPRLTKVSGSVTDDGAFIYWADGRRFQISSSPTGERFTAPYPVSPGYEDALAHLHVFGTSSATHAVWLEEEDGVGVIRHRRVPIPEPLEPPEAVEDLDMPSSCLFEPDPAAVAPAPVITSSTSLGMAPMTVHFHSLDTPMDDLARTESLLAWDFGDVGSAHNRLEGWSAAHVFDDPGTYTVTLTLTTRDGATSTSTSTVDVLPDTRTQLFVSADGDDASDGLTPETAIRTLVELRGRLQADMTVLLRRGDLFETDPSQQDRWFTLSANNVVFTAYGEAEQPLPELRATNRQSILFFDAVSNILVEDLHFTANNGLNAHAISSNANNVTVRRCDVDSIAEGIVFNQGSHLFTADNRVSAQWGYGLRAWGGAVALNDQVHVGNRYNSGNNSPGMLIKGDRLLVANNSISSQDDNPLGLNVNTSNHLYLADNNISRGVGLEGVQHFVLARNLLNQRREPYTALQIDVASGTGQIRNNVMLATEADALVIAGADTAVVNNTIYATAVTPGRLLVVSATTTGLRMINNLFGSTALPMSWAQVVSLEAPAGLAAGCFNLFPTPFDSAWADLASTGWNDHTDIVLPDITWRPPADSLPARFARPAAGVRGDREGTPRPSGGAWTAGALEARP